MIKTNNLIYGTVKECVTEIVNLINWDTMECPAFDFCASVNDEITFEKLKLVKSGIYSGLFSAWYGCRDVSRIFEGECETISLLFGCYGGGGGELVELMYEERYEIESIIKWICNAIDNSTRGELKESDMTLFEIVDEERELIK